MWTELCAILLCLPQFRFAGPTPHCSLCEVTPPAVCACRARACARARPFFQGLRVSVPQQQQQQQQSQLAGSQTTGHRPGAGAGAGAARISSSLRSWIGCNWLLVRGHHIWEGEGVEASRAAGGPGMSHHWTGGGDESSLAEVWG